MYVPRRARPEQRRPGLGLRRHTHRRSAPRLHGRAAAILPRAELSRHHLMFIAQAFAGHAEDHWINVVTSRAGGAFAEVSLLAAAPRGHALHAVPTRPETTSSPRAFTASRYASPSRGRRASTSSDHRSAPRLKAATRRRRRAPRHERPRRSRPRPPRSSGRRASKATSWACVSGAAQLFESTRLAQVLAVISFEWRDTAVYCHAVATSPAYRSRAGSSGSLQAGSRLVAFPAVS